MTHDWEKYFDTNSDYWKKIQKIYEDNEHFPKKVVSGRNLHHKFMRSFSRLEKKEIDNDDDNLVSLSEGDHFLVHYYLWKCTKPGFRNRTANAVKWMYKKSMKFLNDMSAVIIAESWTKETINPNFTMKGHKFSDSSKEKMRKAKKGKKQNWEHGHLKGRHFYNNGIVTIAAFECPEGFVPGRLKRR